MRLLDAFCKQGGAGMGYHRAGFEVVGVDIEAQPRNPFEFVQDDAIEFIQDYGSDFDAIHASPPCLNRTNLKAVNRHIEHVDLVAATRRALIATGRPYVIENVEGNISGGSALIDPVRLCGSSFDLDVRRHRLFECSFPVMAPPCAHDRPKKFETYRHGKVIATACVPVYGTGGGKAAEHWAEAMGIDWMDREGLAQAIPPAYTEHIGGYLMRALEMEAAA
jgi:DNA (cytosine-5)-methyltransferase 1